jgi:hypothetical protein
MSHKFSRRELIRSITAGGPAVAGTMTPLSSLLGEAAEQAPARGPQPPGPPVARIAATLVNGKVSQPQRELSILRKTGVLVVGGCPAGTANAAHFLSMPLPGAPPSRRLKVLK